MDTSDLFITRKRKKWKFAHFAAWPNCFSDASPATWSEFFKNDQPLIVEIGAGTANLTTGQAQLRPQENFVAADIKSDRLYTGAKFALEHNLPNVAFVRAQLRDIGQLFAPQTIKELWITFPDPFPRDRQAKHRLTYPRFLQQYRPLLTSEGVICFKTDNRDLFLWSLEQIVAEGWRMHELSFDLHDSSLPDAYKITTAYERRFMAEGVPINFVSFLPPAL